MKITIVTGPFWSPPPAPGGAVERRWFHVARAFADLGHDVTFLSRRHDESLAADETIDGVRHRRRLSLRSTGNLKVDLVKDAAYSARMLAMLPRADVTVTNVFWLPALMPWLRRRAGKLVVNVARMPKGQLRLYRRAHRLVAPSRAVVEEIGRQAPSLAGRSLAIPNPIATDVFHDDGTPEPAEPTIGYTGRVHPEKGLELLCGAFRRLRGEWPGLKLTIVGPWTIADGGGGEAYRQRLRETAGEGLELLEPIYDRRGLAEAIRSMSVYCYPSLAERGETFGCAPLEAMGCGRAVVVSKLAPFDDYLRHDENGVRFDHRGEGAERRLADALAGLLRDEARRRRLAEQAAADAQRYSFAAVADLYLAEFQSLLRENEDRP